MKLLDQPNKLSYLQCNCCNGLKSACQLGQEPDYCEACDYWQLYELAVNYSEEVLDE